MKIKTVLFCLLALFGNAYAGDQAVVSRAKLAPSKLSFTFDRVPVNQLVMTFYDVCKRRGLVFDPLAARIEEVLTLKTGELTCDQAESLFTDAFARAGVVLESHGSYDLVKLKPPVDERVDWEQFIFRPRFRDAIDLADQCSIVIKKGTFAHKREKQLSSLPAPAAQGQQVAEQQGNIASQMGKQVDILIFFGPPSEVKAVQQLLSILDVPVGQVEIQAGIFEYQKTKTNGSAFNAAMSIFNARLGVAIGAGSSVASGGSSTSSGTAVNSFSFITPDFSAALDLLDQDVNFRSVSRPRLLAMSGQSESFTSGQTVMVPGAITMNASGQSMQSFQNVTAGVMFTVKPLVRLDVVDLSIHETVSDFVPSPNSNPSYLTRDLSADLLVAPGRVYVIGGLNSTNQTVSKNSLFGFTLGEQFTRLDTELLLLVTVQLQSI